MTVGCVAGLVESVSHGPLLQPAQLDELTTDLQHRFPDPHELAQELIRRDWLTTYQVNRLFQGRGQALSLGQYVLLERLGEGGMGQVYKARHRNLGRVVALKVLRKEMLDKPVAVRRFRREVQVCARLTHPNIVRAFDADESAGTFYLVMEYVEGTDLAKLIKQAGPLKVARACDYVRQAALGLQHAHERGLVHRDIKPANLLVTPFASGKNGSSALLPRPGAENARWGIVKILDMGLARLQRDEGLGSGMLTQLGTVMGTPDFIAPEQACDSHASDHRADLYSLGCTFYYLLCGQVPFPQGTLTEKLRQHQLDEPQPVEDVRRSRLGAAGGALASANRSAEVPPRVARLVRQLMAKRPEDRIQTAAELADTLSDLLSPEASSFHRLLSKHAANDLASSEPEEATVGAPAPDSPNPEVTVAFIPGPEDTLPEVRPAKPTRHRLLGQSRPLFVIAGFLLLCLLTTRLGKASLQEAPAPVLPTPRQAETKWEALVNQAKAPQASSARPRGLLRRP